MSRNRDIIFLGNSQSVHISHWQKIYNIIHKDVDVLYTVHECTNSSFLCKRIFLHNKILSYLLLGVYLRFSSVGLMHVHGSSGYGLAAYISGKRYIATVYGSEILGEHSLLYQKMMKLIFKRATSITVTSAVADSRVKNILIKDLEKIFHFHTGINTDNIERNISSIDTHINELPEKYFLSIRNTANQYRTESIIKGFLLSKVSRYGIHLVVFLGNGDIKYFERLREEYKGRCVFFIDKILEQNELHTLTQNSIGCVNFPITDQLSASLLETMYIGKTIISSKLKSYENFIEKNDVAKNMYFVNNEEEIADAMCSLAAYKNSVEDDGVVENIRNTIKHDYSILTAGNRLQILLSKIYE